MTQIGNKIRNTRKQKGLSQEELAEAAKVNLRTIQRIEKGDNEPRGKTLQLICAALDVEAEELLNYGKEKDSSYLTLVHLSVLSFLFVPIGNIILPLILWVNKKEKIEGLQTLGKNVLNFQISWTTINVALMILLITSPSYFDFILLLLLLLLLINLVFPILFAIRINKAKNNYLYPKLLRIIR
ncbi:Uncharacterized conserved protein, Tic20 family [Lishizhenia tianjinensis]|uniref:Uncharacterized conserved protein, Tic20 family n=1 Tax=Lishizhenia tianjinensis TaxID=477690 RepID=A0A1I7A246_9FLAO|nr:helix-turn-helix domain-containing protein [Lishizhenia tianjinensis]SFT68957.1 Uncharacterized conserved protein, Tic20 family [Lishizhenia tianjinensis]